MKKEEKKEDRRFELETKSVNVGSNLIFTFAQFQPIESKEKR